MSSLTSVGALKDRDKARLSASAGRTGACLGPNLNAVTLQARIHDILSISSLHDIVIVAFRSRRRSCDSCNFSCDAVALAGLALT